MEKAIDIWNHLHQDHESLLNIARAYFRLGRYEEAKKQLESLNISVPSERLTPKQISLSLIGPDEWYRFNVGHMVNYVELIEKEMDIERLRGIGINPPMLFAQVNEEALFVLRTTGDMERVIEILTLAARLENAPFYIYYNLGMLHFNLGNLEKTKEYVSLSFQRKADFLGAHDLLGNVYFMEQDYEKAVEEFKKVVEISDSLKDPGENRQFFGGRGPFQTTATLSRPKRALFLDSPRKFHYILSFRPIIL